VLIQKNAMKEYVYACCFTIYLVSFPYINFSVFVLYVQCTLADLAQ